MSATEHVGERNGTSLVDLIGRTCDAFPDRVAVTGHRRTLTFSQLWSQSSELARTLVARGTKVEDPVGLCADQSDDFVVGLVAIMRAGAPYVPLDPGYPLERLRLIANDGGLSCVVGPERFDTLVDQIGATRVDPDGPFLDFELASDLPAVTSERAAYVMFTSGSTGRPKGVVVEHRAVVDLLEWMIRDFDLHPGETFMGIASPNFDASAPNYLLPLLLGGTFVTLDRETTLDPHKLATVEARYRPRALQVSPSMLRMLSEINWIGDPDLDLWTGGEPCAASVIEYIAPRVRSLCNLYGPTETSITVTVARLAAHDTDSPIGFARDNARLVLLDDRGLLVPSGARGELFVTGPALARGYLNDPELTADRFARITLEGKSVRAYRTGDLARQRPDGSFVLLGRSDDQVKIRGYRVEPNEVEQCMMRCAGVVDAVVTPHQSDMSREPRLIAFVKTTPGLTATALRGYAHSSLPDFMVPSAFVFVDSFPLAPSGKIDRKQLIASLDAGDLHAHAGGTSNAPPRTPVERAVCDAFADVLETDASSLGIDDEFFALGGTSLGVVRLFSIIEEHFDIALPLSTLVGSPTIRRLAIAIQNQLARRARPATNEEETQYTWEQMVCNLWLEVLEINDVGPDDDFFALGGSEEDARRMIDRLRAYSGSHVTYDEFAPTPTPAHLARLTSRWLNRDCLVALNSGGTKMPIFCVPRAAAHAMAFIPLASELGPDQPFYGLQAHGLEKRGIVDWTLRATAARYATEIRRVQPQGPYLLLGYSLGGVLAIRAAQILKAQGLEVALVSLIDARLSDHMIGSRRADDARVSSATPTSRLYFARPSFATMVRLPFAGLIRFKGARQFDVFYWLGAIQARLARRLTAWRGRTVLYVSDDELSRSTQHDWEQLLEGEWACVPIPGSHRDLVRYPNVALLATDLRQRMDDALAAYSPTPTGP